MGVVAMKIAVCGKGGSDKSTLFAQLAKSQKDRQAFMETIPQKVVMGLS